MIKTINGDHHWLFLLIASISNRKIIRDMLSYIKKKKEVVIFVFILVASFIFFSNWDKLEQIISSFFK